MDRRDILPALLLALFGALLHAGWALLEGRAATGALPDTDSYARLIRVRELWEGARWTDPVTPSFNAPEGLFLHWTRPLDVLILGPALLLHHGAGLSRADALFWSGAAVCPVLHILAALAAVWAARAVWPRSASWLAGMLLLGTPALFGYSVFGRADHHTLIALAGVLVFGFGLHALRGRRRPAAALGCGVAGGAGLWVSPEVVLFLAPMLAGFGVAWLTGPDPRGAAQQGLRAALAALAMAAVAILSERGPAAAGFIAYDVVALPHLALCAAAAAVFAVAAAGARLPPPGRLLLGAAAGGAGLSLLVAVFPGLPSASLADADAEAATRFLPLVAEMQPLRFGSAADARQALLMLGGPAMVAPLVLVGAWPRFRRGRRRVVFAPLLLGVLLTLWAGLQHLRFAADLAVPAALAAAGLPAVIGHWMARAPLLLLVVVRVTLLLVVVGQPLLVGLAFTPPPAEPSRRSCDALPLARWLAAERPGIPPGGRPVVFADDLNAGPVLAWAGGVRVVAGPYHRGGSAFADTAALYSAETGDAARAVATRRQADFLLLCRPLPWHAGGQAFRARLLAGDLPDWLAPVPLPEDFADRFLLFRVLPAAR